jgi:hypothetical protein
MNGMQLATKQRRVLYVGNVGSLDEQAIEKLFIPFGRIQVINKVGNHSFAFIQYEEANDAADAIDNMHNYIVNKKHVLSVSLKRLSEDE